MAEEATVKKTGWRGPAGSINTAGRPKRDPNAEKKTNRVLRQEEFLSMVRKFKPHLSKAIKSAVDILDDKDAADQNKLKASALIISTYKTLISELYDYRYDEEEGEEVQSNSAPVFSLRMISGDEEEAK